MCIIILFPLVAYVSWVFIRMASEGSYQRIDSAQVVIVRRDDERVGRGEA